MQKEKHLKCNIFYEFQSWFRKSYCIDTCLINLQDGIRMEISQVKYVGMVLLNLQKAFDTLDHDILLEKFDAMGLNHNKWFKSVFSYLKGGSE